MATAAGDQTGAPPKPAELEKAQVAEARFDRIIRQLKNLALYDKLQKTDRLHLITRAEVVELFNILDQNNSGEITREDLLILASIPGSNFSETHVNSIMEDCDRDGNGIITIEELFKAVTQGTMAFSVMLDEVSGRRIHGTNDECSREHLLRYMKHQFNKDDACFSLPFTLLFFTVFLFLIQIHLEISSTFLVHSAIQHEIDGEGGRTNHEGPFLMRDVHDTPTFWDWFNSSFVACTFKSAAYWLPDFPVPGRVGTFNQIVGGVGLTKHETIMEKCEQDEWLQTTYDARAIEESLTPCAYMDGAEVETTEWLFYQMHENDLRDQIENLINTQWLNPKVTLIRIRFLSYNAPYGLFTSTHLDIAWDRQGLYRIRYYMTSFEADPYAKGWKVIIDLLYVALVMKMMYAESKEMIPAIKNGLDGFLDYWEFWNAIDWLSIFTGVVLLAMWLSMVGSISGQLKEEIIGLPSQQIEGRMGLDSYIVQIADFLTPQQIEDQSGQTLEDMAAKSEKVLTALEEIVSSYSLFRSFIAGYILVMMMRFFKAFRANPRLNVVTQTILEGSTDISHFAVVFLTIFTAFVLCAQVLFGSRVKQFSTLTRAYNMAFRILMGEFDFDAMTLGSDLDYLYGTLWFWMFETLVFLIMFNMLLAIVMDTYAKVSGKKEGSETMVEQTFSTYRMLQLTKKAGHLNLWYLICEFEDDDDPAHPEKIVSVRSLRRAFPKMTKHNAEFLIHKTIEHLQDEEAGAEAVTLTMAMKMITKSLQFSKRTSEQMELVYAEMVLARNARINAAMNPMAGPAGGQMMAGAMMPGMMAPGMMGPGGPGGNPNQQMMLASQQLAQQTANAPGGLIDPKAMLKSQQALATGGSTGMSNDMKVTELFDYIRDRNQWLDQRFSEMDKRFERIDRNCGALVIFMDQSKKREAAQEKSAGASGKKNAGDSGTDWRRIRKLEDQVDALQSGNERILELLERTQYREPPVMRHPGSPSRR
ncbi:unnamed protein product [Amoebophrya sp. A120]|nr:unnamed protein product [Amoebophrya sp. A120]|eukprot:GSA120T00006362001.1